MGDPTYQGLITYLQAQSTGYFYLVAVSNAQEASALTLESGRPVLATAGFMGTDPALTPEILAQMVADEQLRFVLGLDSPGMDSRTNSTVSRWVQGACTAVDPAQYGGTARVGTGGRGFGGAGGGFLSGLAGTLYDCAAP